MRAGHFDSSVKHFHVVLLTHVDVLFLDSAMLKASPEDPMLTKMVETAGRRLREIQLQEEDHAKDIPSDDLVYTKVIVLV